MSSLVLLTAASLLSPCLAAQVPELAGGGVRKLNAPLPAVPIGLVSSTRLGPDGERVFYLADNEQNDVFELESAPIDGSAPAVELGAPLVPGGRIASYVISPDSSFVVYRVGRDELNAYDLRRVASDGSAGSVEVVSSRVTTSLVGLPYAVSANGARIVYVADEDQDGRHALYSVASDGSSDLVELSNPQPGPWGATGFALSQDSTRVVYVSDELGGSEAFAVPMAGGAAPLHLSTLGASVDNVWISPDSQRLLYRAAGQLFSVPLDGSQAPVRIDALGQVRFDVRISSDTAYAVFQDETQFQRLFSAPLDGSSPAVHLWSFAQAFRLDPAARRIVFVAPASGGYVLYGVPFDGSSAPVALSGGGGLPEFHITPSGARVVYKAGGMSSMLFSAPLDGSAPPVSLSPTGLARLFALAPDRERVFFTRESTDPDQAGLYVVSADGTESARRISDSVPSLDLGVLVGPRRPVTLAGRLRRASLADQSRVAFKAIRDVPSVVELFGLRQDGGAAPVRLSPPFLPTSTNHDVDGFQLAGSWVAYETDNHSTNESVFRAGVGAAPPAAHVSAARAKLAGIDLLSGRVVYVELVGNRWQLFSRPFDLSAPGVLLSQADPEHGEVRVVAQVLGPAGRVAYSVTFEDARQGLYTVPIDGSAPPVRISGPTWNIESDFRFDADGARLLYRARFSDGFELYSTPADVRDPVVLNAAMPPGGDVESFTVGAGRAVYRADQEELARPELFSVPLDGSANPVKLNLTPVQRVELFELEPSSGRVAYMAAETSEAPVRLYGVSILGGASTPLSSAMVLGGSVQSFRVAPDSGSVVYLADALVNERFELFAVPLDGSAPARKISGKLPTGSVVLDDFRIASGGGWVGYRARGFGVAQLFSAPIDASHAPRRLNAALPGGASVDQFEITPDGARVVYLADQRTLDTLELFLVPLCGGAEPVRVSGPLVEGGDVIDYIRFRLTADSRGVVYCATQDSGTTVELYLATFPRPVEPATIPGG